MKYLVMEARQVATDDATHFYVVVELTQAFCAHLLALADLLQDVKAREPALESMRFDENIPFYQNGAVLLPDPDNPGTEMETRFSELDWDEGFALFDTAPDLLIEPDEPVLGGHMIVDEKRFYYEGFQEEEPDIETEALAFDRVREWQESLRAGG